MFDCEGQVKELAELVALSRLETPETVVWPETA
jgi:hypothetical protein